MLCGCCGTVACGGWLVVRLCVCRREGIERDDSDDDECSNQCTKVSDVRVDKIMETMGAVSYTHLTLPTNREV